MQAPLAWLSTYLLHSTLLLGAACLLRLALRERRLALQEAVLRAALLGGFLTASLQLGLNLEPVGGRLSLRASTTDIAPRERVPVARSTSALDDLASPAAVLRVSTTSDTLAGPAGASHASTALDALDGPILPAREWNTVRLSLTLLKKVGSLERDYHALAARLPSWSYAAVAVWSVLAFLGLVRLAVGAARLRTLLRGRVPLADRDLVAWAKALAVRLHVRAAVRLTTAPRLTVPLATGVLRPEVCLPARAVNELAEEEQVALCAHELAHLARRDPAWILAARVAEALAPMQPLNWWALRRLRDLAECLSDDLAVEASARPLGLARSLVDVASWSFAQPTVPTVMAAGALSARSRLGLRVERLMNPVRVLERPRRLLLPLAACAVLAAALVMPVVSGSQPVRSLAAGEKDVPEPPQPPAPMEAAINAPAPSALDRRQTPPVPPVTAPAPLAPIAVAPAPPTAAAPVPPIALAPVAPTANAPIPPIAVAPVPRMAAAPIPPTAPAAAEPPTDPEDRLEELSQRIVERSQQHEAELADVQAEIGALVSTLGPQQRQLEQLGHDLEGAAADLTEALANHLATGDGHPSAGAAEAARRRMEELQRQMKESLESIHVPHSDIRRLSEKARAMAEAARPTEEEMRELHRLAGQIARESMPSAREISRMAREAASQARAEMRRAAREMHRAAEEMRRSVEEDRKAIEEDREEEPQDPER